MSIFECTRLKSYNINVLMTRLCRLINFELCIVGKHGESHFSNFFPIRKKVGYVRSNEKFGRLNRVISMLTLTKVSLMDIFHHITRGLLKCIFQRHIQGMIFHQ